MIEVNDADGKSRVRSLALLGLGSRGRKPPVRLLVPEMAQMRNSATNLVAMTARSALMMPEESAADSRSFPRSDMPLSRGPKGARTFVFVILANGLAAVFALQTTDDEMSFREALKVLGKKYVERETADGASNGDEFRSQLFAYFKTKSGFDAIPTEPPLHSVGGLRRK